MSTVLPLAVPVQAYPPSLPSAQRPKPQPPQKRRTTFEQGRALEILGHAIEYLVDSRLDPYSETPGNTAAVHVLMVCSRAVFADCELVFPWRQRLQKAFVRRLGWYPSKDGSEPYGAPEWHGTNV